MTITGSRVSFKQGQNKAKMPESCYTERAMNLEEVVALEGNQPPTEKSKQPLEIETVVRPEKNS